ncbi:hypothetical protein P7K49_029837 [Saguinus oedipus]|uniref:Secreted protein n=1 Tax=Saguinus oedipus TaxID=9490 RepID=A0ABQ9U9J6_SAGOE|nr:hypothetical protein P7K49_029837 [Saguinus oedipus]
MIRWTLASLCKVACAAQFVVQGWMALAEGTWELEWREQGVELPSWPQAKVRAADQHTAHQQREQVDSPEPGYGLASQPLPPSGRESSEEKTSRGEQLR